MADIKITVDAMPKKDTSPAAPVVEPVPDVELTAAQIQAVVKELAKPWEFGSCLHSYAVRHGIPLKVVRKIHTALLSKQTADNPTVLEEVK